MRIPFKKRSNLMVFVGSTLCSFLANAAESAKPQNVALYEAILKNDLNGVTRALQDGADPKEPYVTGNLPLIAAINTADPQVVSALLQAGAYVNQASPEVLVRIKMALRRRGNPVIERLFLSQVKQEREEAALTQVVDFI